MRILKREIGPYPLGVWLAIIALVFLHLAWVMQAYSLSNWDIAVDIGIQNERFTGDEAERAWAQESWGVAVADLTWAFPLGVFAIVGIIRYKFYGFAAALMEFSIGIYFPLVFTFQRWHVFRGTAIIALLFWLVPSAVGIVGLVANRSRYSGV